MDTDEEQRVVPFQLQFDKPVPSQIKMAEWNPEKDLLAMVTEDSKLVLHRFNWQRLWTISPGKRISSLCWRPDGKAIAVGLEDGTISLNDVENGKLLKSMKSHNVAVACLVWEEDAQQKEDDRNTAYEDRASHFFPAAPRVPRMHGVVSGDPSFMDEEEDSFQELLSASHQHFNVLCSADTDGVICFSIFGIFPIAKIDIHDLSACMFHADEKMNYKILDASILKVALSKDLCHLTIICSGTISDSSTRSGYQNLSDVNTLGMHCMVLDTSIFARRKNELYQVALQASNIEDLTEVIRASISVMNKQWGDAMHAFHEKFESLPTLISSHGLESSPREEFLSLLGGARTSPPLHQFLVNSLGEGGLKRVMKSVCGAGKELQLIVLDHLQPAVEMIGFRVGELRGLSRWRARFGGIGLDETLIENATERVGMLLVHVENFLKVLSSVVQQFSNFFSWLLKCIKILMSEGNDQFPSYSSELVIVFLKFLYDQDPIKLLLEQSSLDLHVETDMATTQRVEELCKLGGFTETEFLRRTFLKEYQLMDLSFKEAFRRPHTTISKKIVCLHFLPLYPSPPSYSSMLSEVPASISSYKDVLDAFTETKGLPGPLADYISFLIPDGTFPRITNCIGIVRGVMQHLSNTKKGNIIFEAALLSVPDGFNFVDLSLYKEHQLVLILNEDTAMSDGSGDARMMVVQASSLPFVDTSGFSNLWKLQELQDSIFHLQLENEKSRSVPHHLVPPLAVSSSRGVACVFAARKRALVYILEEDEEDEAASEMD